MALVKGTNSYATVAEADVRIAIYAPHDTTWAAIADTSTKEAYLQTATAWMGYLVEWPDGSWPTVSGQDLDWPREGVVMFRGRGEYVDRLTTPAEIGHACIELARWMAQEDRTADDVTETLGITRAGDTSFDRALGGRKVIPDAVRDILHGTGYGYVPSRGEMQVRRAARG